MDDDVAGKIAATLAAAADLTAVAAKVLPVPPGTCGAVARMLDQVAQEITEAADTLRQTHGSSQ
jgi:hypothetical protein